MFNAHYYIGALEAAGISTPAMPKARAILDREIVSDSFLADTEAMAAALAADLAAGNLAAEELERRLSTIHARRSDVFTGLLRQARDLLDAESRKVLADDHQAVGKALRGMIDDATTRHGGAVKILKKRGVIHAGEAMQLGSETATAWAVRDEAVAELDRLASLRRTLVDVGILRADSGAGMITTAARKVRDVAVGVT